MKSVYVNCITLHEFLLSRNIDTKNPKSYGYVLLKKFPFVSLSPKFYLSPMLSDFESNKTLLLTELIKNQYILFSAKSSVLKEPIFIQQQLSSPYSWVNIKNSEHISIIDTSLGGIYYCEEKLLFIFIPRADAIKYQDVKKYVSGLLTMERSKKALSSNRGNSHKVFFENSSSNYIDVGIGVSRFMRGLYRKELVGVSDEDIKNVNDYFSFVENTVKQYLPSCLLEKLQIAMNLIGMEDFNQLKSYNEKKKNLDDLFPTNINTDKNTSFSFMPSASFGSNNLLPLHTDKDMFLSVVHVHAMTDIIEQNTKSYYRPNSKICKYFTFNNGSSVAMRSGDILVFNPTIPHCVSSTTDDYSDDKVFCVSHYFKSLIAGRNDNTIKFT